MTLVATPSMEAQSAQPSQSQPSQSQMDPNAGTATPSLQFPRQGEWGYEHWVNFPNDGWKYEIIDGVLYVSPPPLIDHQRILIMLVTQMHEHARRRRLGTVLCAPCGVRLPGQPVPVEPDILFVRRERLSILAERYVEGAPDLLVEILSPSNATYDLETKYALYERAGVAEYWVVIPWEKLVRVYALAEGRYRLVGEYGPGQAASSAVLDNFSTAVNNLFELEMGSEDV
ncbi:MAG: Uma2 family endonuclease [Caldilineaceae bacterium]|nr:Uma2 family endonuclease [Caldilineaceae bacterium]